MLIVIGYMLQIIYIIKINAGEFMIMMFDEMNNLIISNKSINKFLNKISYYF